MQILSTDQIEKLEQSEQLLMEIIASQEFEALVKSGDYHPDVTLGDAKQAVSYLLNHCTPSSFNPVPYLSELFPNAALMNRLHVLKGEHRGE